jgi:superfamily I DNA/RNA helicase
MSALDQLRDQILAQSPTEEQRKAIFADELEFLLRASPGSGKTWTSCRRFIWRGAKRHGYPGGLALLSFTNTAIREFQAATIKVGRRELLSEPNYVGTFDSFVERFIITPFGHLVANTARRPKLFLSPLPSHWNNKKLQTWIDTKGGRKMPVPAWEIIPYPENGKVAFKASRGYGGQPLLGAAAAKEFHRLGYYTHAHRVYLACILLIRRPHIAQLLARRFPEIIVDEAQDTNVWLLILLNQLREKGCKVTLIGDPDQCIYEFSMAEATSLPELKTKWKIPEMPLSKSFRCNNPIADAVRSIGGNAAFHGNGQPLNGHCRPYIVREHTERFSQSIGVFSVAIENAGLAQQEAAIICRAHNQLELIRGESRYGQLEGVTKELAEASFHRDNRRDFRTAFKKTELALRQVTKESQLWERIDEDSSSAETMKVKLAIWRFVKNESGLPSVSLNGTEWIAAVRGSITQLMHDVGIENPPNVNLRIKKTGLDNQQLALPLFEEEPLFPAIRQDTIHQVKGESIGAVLVLGSTKFWNSVVEAITNGATCEDRRLGYVAMTRARHVLAVGLPAKHFDTHADKWMAWGFNVLQ